MTKPGRGKRSYVPVKPGKRAILEQQATYFTVSTFDEEVLDKDFITITQFNGQVVARLRIVLNVFFAHRYLDIFRSVRN
nr:hypothetical protein [Celeribacter ethanolicus]